MCTFPAGSLFHSVFLPSPPVPHSVSLAADRPVLVCFGDSITAGYGLQTGQSYPDALQRDLDAHGYHYRVNNQGASGATTKDATADIRSILLLHPEIVIVEFGGNDGLRGLPPDQTRRNLDQVLTASKQPTSRSCSLASLSRPTTAQTTSTPSSRSFATWPPNTTSPSCP